MQSVSREGVGFSEREFTCCLPFPFLGGSSELESRRPLLVDGCFGTCSILSSEPRDGTQTKEVYTACADGSTTSSH